MGHPSIGQGLERLFFFLAFGKWEIEFLKNKKTCLCGAVGPLGGLTLAHCNQERRSM
jgi:hypothetical protein